MKASTLFGLTLASMMGLAVVVGAKYVGYFDNAPLVEPRKSDLPEILVSSRNIFRGVTPSAKDVKVRKLTESERDYYARYKDKLLPPVPSAVELRIAAQSIPAGQPLTDDMFEKVGIPESVTERLDPGMRTVSLVVPKERAGGGLLQVGERVDILMTSAVCSEPRCGSPFTATATIARNLKIVVKRDNLWKVMAGVPEEKPVSLILQANPYRAALLEYAKMKGVITIVPAAPGMMMKDKEPPMSDPDSREYRDEEKRVAQFMNNEQIVTDADLERIFNLRLLAVPAPTASSRVEMMVGTRIEAHAVIKGKNVARVQRNASNADVASDAESESPTYASYRFSMPDGSSFGGPAGCATCGKNNTKG
jgi:Flp pilus assembly protein CpaB